MNKITAMVTKRDQLLEQRETILSKMDGLNDKASAERREFSSEEKNAYKTLEREYEKNLREVSDMNNRIQCEGITAPKQAKNQNQMLRECLQNTMEGKGKKTFTVVRDGNAATFAGVELSDLGVGTGSEGGNLIPLSIKDVINPLELGLILDKVGVPMQTGVHGNISWPYLSIGAEATILGEKESLTDTDLEFEHLNAVPRRMGITIPVTYSAINDSAVDLVALVQSQLRASIARTLNRVMFSHQNFTSQLHGPFAGAKASGTFAKKTPTYKELMAMVGAVVGEGVEAIGGAFVMSAKMFYTLKATPKDAGSGLMIIDDNGMLGGIPVFVTEFINYTSSKTKASDEYIAFGMWGYVPVNQHGDVRIVVDPFTRAKEDILQLTLNTEFSMTTLREEAFALYKSGATE